MWALSLDVDALFAICVQSTALLICVKPVTALKAVVENAIDIFIHNEW